MAYGLEILIDLYLFKITKIIFSQYDLTENKNLWSPSLIKQFEHRNFKVEGKRP